MKKYFLIIALLLTVSGFSQQRLAENFDVKGYAQQQTEMIQSALGLDQATADKVYKANLAKAHSLHKWILLAEKRGNTQGKTLEQVIKDVKQDAERGAGYQKAMKNILGEEKYQQYLEKFPK